MSSRSDDASGVGGTPGSAAVSGADAVFGADEVELQPEEQQLISQTYDALDRLDHYALLGISPDADKTAIRQAYFELSKRFHPDSKFRRRLGGFKPKMEAIFKRLTEAYDTLSKKASREAYDAARPDPRASRPSQTASDAAVLAQEAARRQRTATLLRRRLDGLASTRPSSLPPRRTKS